MKRIILALLLIYSSTSIISKSIYYKEWKALKESKLGKILFDEQDANGLSYTQVDIDQHESFYSDELSEFLEKAKEFQQSISLSSINKSLLLSKRLRWFEELLQADLIKRYQPVIVSFDTMPLLNRYITTISSDLEIAKPFVFITQQEGFSVYSRKIVFFKGCLLIGENVVHDLTQEELQALIARELASIKYNHSNKKYALQIFFACCYGLLLKKKDEQPSLVALLAIPFLVNLVFNKKFEDEVDTAAGMHGKAEGLIKFYERLQKKYISREKKFHTAYLMLQKNKSALSFIMHSALMLSYYVSQIEHTLVRFYNRIAHNSFHERISILEKYL